jgi:PAS domain-containing protein
MSKFFVNLTGIRARTISVIVLSILLITVFSVLTGVMYVRNAVKASQESDLSLVAQTADLFLSSEIKLLKEQAINAAHLLSITNVGNWYEDMEQLQAAYPEFIGMTIFDENDGILAFMGESPATADIKNDEYIKQAFTGKVIISSSIPLPVAEDGQKQVAFYLAAPIPETPGRILILTLPELFLANRLFEISVWETGHIFVDDREGTIISNRNTVWIKNRQNFIKMAETDSAHEQMASVLRRPADGETGTGYFSVAGVGVTRLCAFRPIRGSDEGWFLGVVAPLPNSPFMNVEKGLMIVGLVSLFLGIFAAILASGFISRFSMRMTKALEHHDNLLDAVNKTAGVLLTTKEETFEDSLIYGMGTLGRAVDADRVRIMKNETIDGELYFVYQYEWISDSVSKEQQPIKVAMYPYTVITGWLGNFTKSECLNGSLSSLSPGIRDFFIRIQTKSALVIPIFIDGDFWGLVSFLDCVRERIFTDDEVNILRSGALMMSSAINRRTQNAKIREGHNRTKLLLNSMPYACHLWNRNLEMFDCNEANVRLYKLGDKHEIMERFQDYSPEYQPDGRLSGEKAHEMLRKAFDDGGYIGEWMHITSDGEPLPVEMTLVRVAHDDDYVVAAYARDLREHNKLMDKMMALQERLWEKVEVGMVIIDVETRKVLDANPAAGCMYGGGVDKMTGRVCYEFFGQHECPIIDAEQTIDREERKFTKADGTVIPIQKSISRIIYNGKPAFRKFYRYIIS